MATVNLGRIKPQWQGSWSSSTQYVTDDMVAYNNDSWIATTTSTNSAPSDGNSDWDLLARGVSAGSVTATEIADGAITAAKISDATITAAKLAPGAAVPDQSGNSGKALVTDGSNLSWGTVGALDLLASDTVSSVSQINMDYFSATYKHYIVRLTMRTSNNAYFYWRFRTGSGGDSTGNYQWVTDHAYTGGTPNNNVHGEWGGNEFRCGTNQSASGHTYGIELNIHNPHDTVQTYWRMDSISAESATGQFDSHQGGGRMQTTTSYSGIQVWLSAGTMSGDYAVYGVK